MFKGLKNKIKEETGSDISKISPLLSNASQKVAYKGRHSRQGSTSSIGSISVDGIREENSQSPTPHETPVEEESKLPPSKDVRFIEKRDEEWKKRLNKLEGEWKKKMEEKEKEWKKILEAKENEKKSSDQSVEELQRALTSAEEFRTKYCRFQEEREQLEGFQTQEMAKIKHLLLAKERDLTEKLNTIKDCNAQISTLKLEVARLRRFEEEISNVQDEMETLRHSSEQERSTLRSELAQSEENVRHLRDRVAVLERRTSADCVALGAPLSIDERVQGLLGERALLERRLEEAHLHLADIKSSWSSKITSLETQVGRLCRQAAEEGTERRRAEKECLQLEERIQQLEVELVTANEKELQSSSLAQEMEQLRRELEATTKDKEEVSGKLEETQSKLEAAVRDLQGELKAEQEKVSELQFKSETEARDLRNEISELKKLLSAETETSRTHVDQLQQELVAEQGKCAGLSAKLDFERSEKEVSVNQCAEISKQIDLLNQQLEKQKKDVTDLRDCVCTLESKIISKDEELTELHDQKDEMMRQLLELQKERDTLLITSKQEKDFQETIADLESQLLEKNKNIKQLQQRLGDMKKTLQKELNLHPGGFGESGSNGSAMGSAIEDTAAAVLAPSSSHQVSQRRLQQQAGATSTPDGYNDVNFQYLKHVLIKFLTSREYEAKHLTRAVATLLHFSPEEERLLRETLEWKMSWFGSRPNLGFGQTAKTIPPPS